MQFVQREDAICLLGCFFTPFFILLYTNTNAQKYMTLTIIVILAVAVVLLIAALAILMGLFWRKNRELKQKNDAIIREMYRSQNIIERAVKHGVSRAALLSLLFGVCIVGKAQEECFEYEDTDKTIITGLTEKGKAATSLTIPSSVTTVNTNAFKEASSSLSSLTIDNGGDPTFQSELFGDNSNTLTYIHMGNNMSVSNMMTLFKSLGTFKESTTIVADGFSGEKDVSNDTWEEVTWTNVAYITLPAELIAEQTFGEAEVFGRFRISNATTGVGTTCVQANFYDKDDGSHYLFYVATKVNSGDKEIKVERVKYIKSGEGILMKYRGGTASYADLNYAGTGISPSPEDTNRYNAKLFKGTIDGITSFKATEMIDTNSDGTPDTEYSNLVLSQGAFHPVNDGGSLPANRAYLQIPTATLNTILATGSKLSIAFPDDDETTAIDPRPSTLDLRSSDMYNLAGQRVGDSYKGIVIVNGKKIIK